MSEDRRLDYTMFVFNNTTDIKENYVLGEFTYVYYSLTNEDKDFLDKLSKLLHSYNVDILGCYNMSTITNTQEEMTIEKKRLSIKIRDTQFDIYSQALKYFSVHFDDTFINYSLSGVLATLNRLLKFDEKVIVDINKVISQFTGLIDSNCLTNAKNKILLH